MVFDMPVIGQAARKAGHTMACTTDAHRLLAAGELTAVFPEGYKGLGKRFEDRYGCSGSAAAGFVSAALRTKAPIVPCSIVGSEEIYPMLADVKLLARLFGLPYFPITPLFPLAGPRGPGAAAVEMAHRSSVSRSTPTITTTGDADDPMVTFELTDQVRETIQQTLYRLLGRPPQRLLRLSFLRLSPLRSMRSRRRCLRAAPASWSAASPSMVTMLVTTGLPSASVTSLRISAITVPW